MPSQISDRLCQGCAGSIPDTRGRHGGPIVKFCSSPCQNRAKSARHYASPEGKAGQLRRSQKYEATPKGKAKRARITARSNAKRAVVRFHSIYGEDKEYHPSNMTNDRFRHARVAGYRSGLEVRIAKELSAQGVPAAYEEYKIKFVRPPENCTYTPDYVLPNGIVIESKGRFESADRKKHKIIQKQYPDLDIRFVFSRSATTISKVSKTSYAQWCETNNFQFADKSVPAAWIAEAPKPFHPALIN